MRILLTLFIVALPLVTSAFVATETIVTKPYEIIPIEHSLTNQVLYLGTLEDYPIMYEVVLEEPFTFTAQLQQPTNQSPEPLSLLLIRRNDRGGGVTEIARQKVDPAQWTRTSNKELGISLLAAEPLQVELQPGTYRLEVSSPTNVAQYLLALGAEPTESGYFEQLGYVRQTQSYFGFGFLTMLRSSLVYYPIGILILLGVFVQTYRFTQRRNQTQPQPETPTDA